jgi:hypothetical protein
MPSNLEERQAHEHAVQALGIIQVLIDPTRALELEDRCRLAMLLGHFLEPLQPQSRQDDGGFLACPLS